MSRRFIRLLSACLCVALIVPNALACINDGESDNAEKEFKSRYIQDQVPKGSAPASRTPATESRFLAVGATFAGVALLIGAVSMTLLPRRKHP